MSTYDDSSLFLYPSGYKASVLFAQKPMDANGQLAFTRSNDTATRVASNGLIERVRTNLILQSQAFNTVAWTLVTSGTGITPIVTANNATAPDGTMTADTIVFSTGAGTTASDISTITQSATAGSQTYTASFYARVASGTGQLLFRHAAGGQYTTANLTTTWQRFSSTETGSSAFEIGIRRGLSNEPINASVTVQIWGAQFETSDFGPTPYIPTTTAAVSVGPVANIPRINYLGGGCGKLLLEPQRTNLITFSEQIDNAAWVKTNATVTANATTSPAGYVDADKVVATTTNGLHRFRVTVSGVTAQSYTMSIFAKKGEYNFIRFWEDVQTGFQSFYNLDTGVATNVNMTSVGIQDYGNGWYRCTATVAIPASGSFGFRVLVSPDGTENSYAGNGTNGVFVWGAQLEAGSYATSYVNTLAASVTRGADAATKTSIGSLFGSSYTLFGEFVNQGIANTRLLTVKIPSGGNYDNFITIFQTGTGLTATGNDASSVAQFSIASGSYTVGQTLKFALRCSANNVAFYINGVQIGTDNTATIPAVTALWVGNYTDVIGLSVVNQVLTFPTALSNGELAALTTL